MVRLLRLRPLALASTPASTRMSRHLRTALLVACTLGLLALFLHQANLREVWAEIRSADGWMLLLALAATGLTYILRAWRWQKMLEPIGSARFATALRTTVIGFAANALLPARAGEVLRPYLLARREGLSATSTFATIIVERLLDLVAVLALFGAFVFFFDPGMTTADGAVYRAVQVGGLSAAAAAGVVLVLFFVLAGHPERLGRAAGRIERVLPARLARAVERLVETFASGLAVMRQPRALAVALVMSAPLWLSISAGIWFVAQAFHITMPFTGSFLIVALLTVGVAVPTPGAVGGFHYAFRVGATVFYGVPNERAVGAAIVLHAISFVPVTVAGLILMVQDGLSFARVRSMASGETEDRGRMEGLEAATPARADDRSAG